MQKEIVARTIADGSFERIILDVDKLNEDVPFKDEVCMVPPINSHWTSS